MSDYFGKETPKLGFGLMRLPKQGSGTDIEQVKEMVDLFMEAGFTYFDTAFVYGTSEQDIKEALVDRYPRDSYTLATKLNAFMLAPTEKDAKQQFYTSLERTGEGRRRESWEIPVRFHAPRVTTVQRAVRRRFRFRIFFPQQISSLETGRWQRQRQPISRLQTDIELPTA